MIGLKSLKAEIQKTFPESKFKVWQQSSWSQNSAGYREEIRQFASALPGLEQEKTQILDLEKPLIKAQRNLAPHGLKISEVESSKSTYFSISHSTQSGVLAQSLIPIGVDIELIARVSEKIVARVSSPEELHQAPSAAFLWAAKEACFKSLIHFQQPQTVSQIEITDWTKNTSDIFAFDLKYKERFRISVSKGFVLLHHSEALAVFFAKP